MYHYFFRVIKNCLSTSQSAHPNFDNKGVIFPHIFLRYPADIAYKFDFAIFSCVY